MRRLVILPLLLAVAGCGHPRNDSTNLGNRVDTSVAQAAETSGNMPLAVSVYANASRSAPTDAKVQLDYADVLLRTNQIVLARNVLTSHMQTVNEPRLLRGPLGVIDLLTGDAHQAVDEFDAAIAVDPDNMRWPTDKAIAFDMLGQHAAAQVLYHKALGADPNNYITTINLALSLALSGHKAEAATMVTTLASRTDLSQRALLTCALLRAAVGDDASGARQTMDTAGYDQLLKLAKMIGTTSGPVASN